MRVKIQGRKYHLKNSVIIRMQGLMLTMIALMCYRTGADDAALFMGSIGLLMIFNKTKRRICE